MRDLARRAANGDAAAAKQLGLDPNSPTFANDLQKLNGGLNKIEDYLDHGRIVDWESPNLTAADKAALTALDEHNGTLLGRAWRTFRDGQAEFTAAQFAQGLGATGTTPPHDGTILLPESFFGAEMNSDPGSRIDTLIHESAHGGGAARAQPEFPDHDPSYPANPGDRMDHGDFWGNASRRAR
jgi:hypothetical protein